MKASPAELGGLSFVLEDYPACPLALLDDTVSPDDAAQVRGRGLRTVKVNVRALKDFACSSANTLSPMCW